MIIATAKKNTPQKTVVSPPKITFNKVGFFLSATIDAKISPLHRPEMGQTHQNVAIKSIMFSIIKSLLLLFRQNLLNQVFYHIVYHLSTSFTLPTFLLSSKIQKSDQAQFLMR